MIPETPTPKPAATKAPAERVPPTEFPVTVRATFQPDRDLEVGQAEWTDLSRSGLLVDGHDGYTTKEG